MTDPELTILLTAHNEASNIERVIRQVHTEIASRVPARILVAEDGSSDGTKEILKRLQPELGLRLTLDPGRKGYSLAVADSLRLVDTKYVFFMDGDGQFRTCDFWKLYPYRSEADIVSGWRITRADVAYRRIMSNVFQLMARRGFGLPYMHDITGPFRLMTTESAQSVARRWKYMHDSFWTEFTILAHELGFTTVEVPVEHLHRPPTEPQTQIYSVGRVPRIAVDHTAALLKLWLSLNKNGHLPVTAKAQPG